MLLTSGLGGRKNDVIHIAKNIGEEKKEGITTVTRLKLDGVSRPNNEGCH